MTPLDLRVGWFLAWRQLRRASRWTTALIISVMLLTFLNLVVITGFLVGIVQGITDLYRQQQTGDVLISTLPTKNYIENSVAIEEFVNSLPSVAHVSARYVSAGQVEANYKTRADQSEKANQSGANIVGIDPTVEDNFSHVSTFIGEGAYLATGDWDQVLIGSQLIDRYAFGGDFLPNISALHNVYPGTKVRVTINGQTREMTVKGIIISTANSPLASQVLMLGDEMRVLLNREDYGVNQIAIRLKSGADPVVMADILRRSGIGQEAQIKTAVEAIPNGVAEVRSTFNQIGNAISSVGLIVAAITIFIVIFINAVTRRKFIGILKGIGISNDAIEAAYMFQSLFYATIGSAIGFIFLYTFLVPYVQAHPITLPISHAIIVAPLPGTLLRMLLLGLATVIAGFIPARMIVKKNTLDSILGRN